MDKSDHIYVFGICQLVSSVRNIFERFFFFDSETFNFTL